MIKEWAFATHMTLTYIIFFGVQEMRVESKMTRGTWVNKPDLKLQKIVTKTQLQPN